MTHRFTDECLDEVMDHLTHELQATAGADIWFEALNPDVSDALYAGELTRVEGTQFRYRGWDVWSRLARLLGARLLTPAPVSAHVVRIGLRAWREELPWHDTAAPSGASEKYGVGTEYARIPKLEEPSLLRGLRDALDMVRLPTGANILELGANQGQALDWLWRRLTARGTPPARLVGLDHCASAIAAARSRYPDPTRHFEVADLCEADALPTGPFDLVVALHVLHSPRLDGRAILKRVVRECLSPRGGIILGLPNSRYVDRQLVYGARSRGRLPSELSVVHKQVHGFRRYLEQHGFVVEITGEHTVLVTARRRPRP